MDVKKIGDNLRELRLSRKLRQVDLGKIIGTDQAGVSKRECGQIVLTAYELYVVCNHFKIRSDVLLRED